MIHTRRAHSDAKVCQISRQPQKTWKRFFCFSGSNFSKMNYLIIIPSLFVVVVYFSHFQLNNNRCRWSDQSREMTPKSQLILCPPVTGTQSLIGIVFYRFNLWQHRIFENPNNLRLKFSQQQHERTRERDRRRREKATQFGNVTFCTVNVAAFIKTSRVFVGMWVSGGGCSS